MLDRYEKALIETILDILNHEDLESVPAARIIKDDDTPQFLVVAKLHGEEIVLSWNDDKGEVYITMTNWKNRWALTVDVFAAAMRTAVEGTR